MNRMMTEMTGQPIEKVKQDVERDYFMTRAGGAGLPVSLTKFIEPRDKAAK